SVSVEIRIRRDVDEAARLPGYGMEEADGATHRSRGLWVWRADGRHLLHAGHWVFDDLAGERFVVILGRGQDFIVVGVAQAKPVGVADASGGGGSGERQQGGGD